jgi:hypothetical protein
VAQKNQAQASAPSCGANTSPLLRRAKARRGPSRVSACSDIGTSAAQASRAAAPTPRVATRLTLGVAAQDLKCLVLSLISLHFKIKPI